MIEVSITDTTTGETRLHHDKYEDESADNWPPFNWTEGDYACDCNRALFFARANDAKAPDPNIPCGHGRYTVVLRGAHGAYEC